jgi:hypothetical protein
MQLFRCNPRLWPSAPGGGSGARMRRLQQPPAQLAVSVSSPDFTEWSWKSEWQTLPDFLSLHFVAHSSPRYSSPETMGLFIQEIGRKPKQGRPGNLCCSFYHRRIHNRKYMNATSLTWIDNIWLGRFCSFFKTKTQIKRYFFWDENAAGETKKPSLMSWVEKPSTNLVYGTS